jgi:hypothetical protein
MEEQNVLSRAFNYYLENQPSFVSDYNGKYIVLVESGNGFIVAGSYDARHDAVSEAQKSRPLGTFLVQRVSPGATEYTMSLPARMRLTHS